MGVTPASSGGGQLARLSGGYQSPTESSLRQDAGDAQRKAPMAPRIPASSLPVADLNYSIQTAKPALETLINTAYFSLCFKKGASDEYTDSGC